jgi:hypothetical protein
MRYQSEIYTYSHHQQRKKKNQKERNHYYYYFNLLNPEGTDHVLLTGDILTSYQQYHGEGMPEAYGINYNEIKDKERLAPDKNVYAISVMSLDSIQWTKNHKPISRAGYSIFIYDFR